MDYMVNGMLAEIQPEEKTEDQVMKEYLVRFKKEKEGQTHAE